MGTPGKAIDALATWLPLMCCPTCGMNLALGDDALVCEGDHHWPIKHGVIRFAEAQELPDQASRNHTASSFAFEWERFGIIRDEWERNFLDYMQPHEPGFFNGLKVLDAGTGSGRHARQAAIYGAQVAAVDLGDSIDVARRNVPDDVLTVQSDLEALPFRSGSFDFVMSIGVLHHLPDTERALQYLVAFVKPGGRLRVYLYWQPERSWHRSILRGVAAARRVTTRLPHRLLLALCYPLSLALWVFFVGPHRLLRRFQVTRGLADSLPLKTYADYPFGVLVNDQFDRLSAPVERRYTSAEVTRMMERAGLEEVFTTPNAGWVSEGVRPSDD